MLNYDDHDYSKGCSQIKKAFKTLTKDDIPQRSISHNDFRSSNNCNDVGYNLYVFDIRYQKNPESARPIKLEFKFLANNLTGRYGHALVLTNKLVNISSDGQRHFDFI